MDRQRSPAAAVCHDDGALTLESQTSGELGRANTRSGSDIIQNMTRWQAINSTVELRDDSDLESMPSPIVQSRRMVAQQTTKGASRITISEERSTGCQDESTTDKPNQTATHASQIQPSLSKAEEQDVHVHQDSSPTLNLVGHQDLVWRRKDQTSVLVKENRLITDSQNRRRSTSNSPQTDMVTRQSRLSNMTTHKKSSGSTSHVEETGSVVSGSHHGTKGVTKTGVQTHHPHPKERMALSKEGNQQSQQAKRTLGVSQSPNIIPLGKVSDAHSKRKHKKKDAERAQTFPPEATYLIRDKAVRRLRHEMVSESKVPKSAKERRMKKVNPSAASGGIPIVLEAYRIKSESPVRLLPRAQNLLVVIDLNGTLLFRPSVKQPKRYIARPFARDFLQYCSDTFTVVIWSSARSENVQAMCETLLTPTMRQKVVAIWGRDKFGLCPSDFSLRVQCYKRLTFIWEDVDIAQSHPSYRYGGRWDQRNTVLIDDSLEKGRSEPHNLILIPEFLGSDSEVGFVLPQVHDYLNYLAMHENVSASVRQRPFLPFVPMYTPPATTPRRDGQMME